MNRKYGQRIKVRRPWGIWGVSVVLAFLSTRCIDPYAVDLGEAKGRIVVEGRIHAGEGPYYVRIGQVAEFGKILPEPVKGAVVTLTDDEAGAEQGIETEPGYYVFPGEKVRGVSGHTYVLEIQLPDGRIIRSEGEKMPPTVKGDSLRFDTELITILSESEQIIEQRVVQLFVHTATQAFDNQPGPFLRWETSEMYMFPELDHPDPRIYPNTCYITKPIEQNPIRLFSRQRTPVDRWDGNMLVQRYLNWEFEHKHYFTVTQISTTEAAYQYWNSLDEVGRQSGSLLDTPPAPVYGNLAFEDGESDRVLGFFEAVAIDTMRVFTLKTDFPGYQPRSFCVQDYRVNPVSSFGYPSACYACWQLPGSSFQRPVWW